MSSSLGPQPAVATTRDAATTYENEKAWMGVGTLFRSAVSARITGVDGSP
jgi:hypothetical protein